MQVIVFVRDAQQSRLTQMLILPDLPNAQIPSHLQDHNWRYLMTTQADDSNIGMPPGEVDVAIAYSGYVLATPSSATRYM